MRALDRINEVLERGGSWRADELELKCKVSRATLDRLAHQGDIDKIAPGIYQLAGASSAQVRGPDDVPHRAELAIKGLPGERYRYMGPSAVEGHFRAFGGSPRADGPRVWRTFRWGQIREIVARPALQVWVGNRPPRKFR